MTKCLNFNENKLVYIVCIEFEMVNLGQLLLHGTKTSYAGIVHVSVTSFLFTTVASF